MVDPDVVEVVAMLGDSIIEVAYVGADRVFRWNGLAIDVASLGVPARGHVRTRIGHVTFALCRTRAPRRELPRGLRADRRALGYLLGSIALHALLWGFAASAPGEDGATSPLVVVGTIPSGDLHPILSGAHPTTPPLEVEDSPDQQKVGSGAPMAMAAGRAGSLTSTRASGHIQIARRAQEPAVARLTREEAVEVARHAGVLGSTALSAAGFASLISDRDLSSGFDTSDVHAPLYGGTGEAAGAFGLGYRGADLSGGCDGVGCGTIGVGRYATISNGTHTGEGWGGGRAGADGGRGRMREHAAQVPQIRMCGHNCVISGSLDKAIIRRYMRRNNARFQYCYEKELLAHPELAGVVVLDFLIEPAGHVGSSTASGFDDTVAGCLNDVVRAIEFPGALDATAVKYPIEFRFAGE